MILPLVHLNGTSQGELMEQGLLVLDALRKLQKVMCNAAPNGRDYYCHPNGNMTQQAIKEHCDRLAEVNKLVEFYTSLVDYVADAEGGRP